MLDLKVWCRDHRVLHTFYKKPVSSMYTILKRSAVSDSVKRSTVFQESIRRISHISTELPWQETIRHLSDYSQCMKISGYSVEERFNAIKGSVLRMEEMRKKVSDGEIQIVNRKKSEIIHQKIDKDGITSLS